MASESAFGGNFLELGDIDPDTTVLGAHSETIVFHSVSSNDSDSTTLPDITLTVIDDVVSNGSLTISGAVANQTDSDGDVIAPFADVGITDPTSGQAMESLTVTLSSPSDGTLSSLNGGNYDPSSGAFSISGGAADMTAALDTLLFTPASGFSGTTVLTINVSDDAGKSASANSSITVGSGTSGAGTSSLTGDNAILLQNASGQAAIWDVSGATLTSSALLGANPGPNWKDVGTGDFNDDRLPDILLQNTNGAIAIWETNGTSVTSSAVVANPGPNWHAIGTGDFNDDGHSDILLQNTNGAVAIWEMNGANGTTVADSAVVASPGPNWKVVGTGDFNGDGHSDILLQNTNGTVAIWEMNGVSATSSAVVANPGPNWHAIGTGGGGSDILLQNTSGQTAIWDMTGTNITGSGAVSANAGPNWRAVGLT